MHEHRTIIVLKKIGMSNKIDRRDFLKKSVISTTGALVVPSVLFSGCKNGEKKIRLEDIDVPEIALQAPDGRPLKAGLVGCGGRGTGAAVDFVSAGNGLSIVALGDVFEDRLKSSREKLAEKGITVADDKCFIGFDAYKKVIDSDIDVVLLCTPPAFRPEHFAYAVEKGKHVFVEKPCAVDPAGARKMLALGKQADAKGLSVISGTIRRSQKDCIETYRRVAAGMIGDIVSAHVVRFNGKLWHIARKPEWTDMEYMLRNWVNFCWTSGDFIVEQFIHEIDQMTWFMGDIHPVKAQATGGRVRRVTGDMFDQISVEYIYENGHRAHCTSRQIGGCDNEHCIMVYGTKGYTNCNDTIFNLDGSIAWKYPKPEKDDADQSMAVPNPYMEEHVRLVRAIRENNPVNDIEKHVQSVMIALMGRMAAYTGKFVTWDDVLASKMDLVPAKMEFGPVEGVTEEFPLPGVEYKI